MPTIRQQVRDAVEAALNGVGKPGGLTIGMARKRPAKAAELPLSMIVMHKETTKRNSDSVRAPVVERTMRMAIDHWVSDAEDPQAALEAQLDWATTAIVGSGLLGNTVRDITEDETQWDWENLELQFGRATQWFTIKFTTKTNDQELKQ